MAGKTINPWIVLGEKIIGPVHERTGIPCQDAILWRSLPADEGMVLAIADGHGSKSSPYSDIGAAIAVQVAVDLLACLYKEANGRLMVVKHMAEERLAHLIVRTWTEKVLAVHSSTQAGTKAHNGDCDIDDSNNIIAVQQLSAVEQRDILLQYGSTLLAVLATEKFLLFFQIGDGDFLLIGKDGVVNRPIARNIALPANETQSLCMRNAWLEAQVILQPVHGDVLSLVLAATDGYANSFASEEGFASIGTDYLQLLQADGPVEVEQNLKNWLTETSAQGSGDDIALGLLLRREQAPVNAQRGVSQDVAGT